MRVADHIQLDISVAGLRHFCTAGFKARFQAKIKNLIVVGAAAVECSAWMLDTQAVLTGIYNPTLAAAMEQMYWQGETDGYSTIELMP